MMRYVYKKKYLLAGAFVLDLLGNIVSFPFNFFRRGDRGKVDRILVIRVDHIGDVIAASAVLEPLKDAFPSAAIDLLGPSWASDIMRDVPFIDSLIEFDAPWFKREKQGFGKSRRGLSEMSRIIKEGNYDIVIDLRGDLRHIAAMFLSGAKRRIGYGITGGGFLLTDNVPYEGQMHEVDRDLELLKPLGIKDVMPAVKVMYSEEDSKNVLKLKEETGLKNKYAVIHASPGHPSKNWSRDAFAKVTDHIFKEKGIKTVFVGAAGDKETIEEIRLSSGAELTDLSGRTGLGVLAALLRDASLFVGVDSGPAHIAAVSGTPTVIVFSGVNEPDQWVPRGENVKVVYPGRGKDLSSVTPEEVCKVIDEVLL